jgi:hypothetical protein
MEITFKKTINLSQTLTVFSLVYTLLGFFPGGASQQPVVEDLTSSCTATFSPDAGWKASYPACEGVASIADCRYAPSLTLVISFSFQAARV